MEREQEPEIDEVAGVAERMISGPFLSRPDSWDRLAVWVMGRAAFLPLIGMDRYFVRQIERMAPGRQADFLKDLPDTILTVEEAAEWERLVRRFNDAVGSMIDFWRIRRGI